MIRVFLDKVKSLTGQHAPDTDLLRRYIEGEVSPTERLYVEQQIHRSSEWMNALENAKQYIHALNHLPVFEPSPAVWTRIRSEIAKPQKKAVMVTSRDMWNEPVWNFQKLAWAGIGLFLLALVYYVQSSQEPDFVIVDVTDANGFAVEADSYVANHDLNTERHITQAKLLAFFPEQKSDPYSQFDYLDYEYDLYQEK